MHSSLEIVALSLEHWVAQLRHFDDDSAGTYIQVFISCVFVLDLMAVWRSLLDEDPEGVDTIDELLPSALMTCRCNGLALSFTLFALLLELLDETWRDLLFFDYDTLPIALCARFDVFRILTTTTSTVRANDLPVVLNFVVFTGVELLQ